MFARRSLAALACLLVFLPIHAKDASDQVERYDWQLGALALVRNGGYVGDAKQTLVVPAVGYEGQDVFLRGLQAGWHAWQRGGWRLDLIAQARLDGFDAKDIPIAGLEDRRKSIDVGAALSLSGTMGKLEASAVTDALNRSGGQELTVSYGYPFLAGHVRITPQVGVRYWSSNLTDYYYGIDPREVARGAPETYVVGSVVTPEAGLNVVAPLSRRWSLWGVARYQHLPSAVARSPLVSGSSASTLLVGLTYGF